MNLTLSQLNKILKKGNVRLHNDNVLPSLSSKNSSNGKKVKPVNAYIVFYAALDILGIEKPVPEYRFCKSRRWKFDFCFVKAQLALEIEGGVWTNGRHTRGSGFIKDMEKYHQANLLGFKLLRVTPEQLDNGVAVGLIEQYFKRILIK